MGKLLRCSEVLGCDAVLYGKDESDVIGKAEDHARTTHNMTIIPPHVVGDIVVIAFMLGGTALSVTSLVLAWRAIGRTLRGVVPGGSRRRTRVSDDLALAD